MTNSIEPASASRPESPSGQPTRPRLRPERSCSLGNNLNFTAAASSRGLSEISRISWRSDCLRRLRDDQHPDRLLIQKHRFSISTAVADYALCASGCSLTWLAGKDRFTGTGARVGFHAARLNDTSSEIASGAKAVVRRHARRQHFLRADPASSSRGPRRQISLLS